MKSRIFHFPNGYTRLAFSLFFTFAVVACAIYGCGNSKSKSETEVETEDPTGKTDTVSSSNGGIDQGETKLYALSYYFPVDLPAPPFIFISVLNPKSKEIARLRFTNPPQSRLHSRTFYTPQIEKNLGTYGISALRFINLSSGQVKDSLFTDILNNKLEITYKDSTRQTVLIKEIPKWNYFERGVNDTIPISFW